MLLTDDEPLNPYGYVGEVMAVNRTGTLAIGSGAGVANKDAYRWTMQDGVVEHRSVRGPGLLHLLRLGDRRAERGLRRPRAAALLHVP